MLARRKSPPLKGTLIRVTSVPLKEQLQSFSPALTATCPGISGQFKTSVILSLNSHRMKFKTNEG
jgi:hypothetical protein